jgi:cytoplasmic iron level regulating protein YaaA (DUF328/UPF0246 family)
MLAIISPAKTLDYQRPLPEIGVTRPRFEKDAATLASAAAKLSEKKLSGLMHISANLAKLNVARFREFDSLPERPAIYAFAGDVYAGLEVHSMDEDAVTFAQGHLRMLSGLYGLLRPFDVIRPYRLEMGTKWAPGRRRDLYAFWDDRIAQCAVDDLAGSGSRVIINLASKEYWGAIGGALPDDVRAIEIDFREEGPDGPRFNTFSGKRARGMMARYICEHRLDDPEQIKGFDSDGYRFDPENSDLNRWRFMRR